MSDDKTSLTPEAQLAVQKYINNYLARISALVGGLNLLVILGGVFYLYIQGVEIVRVQAESEVEAAVSKFELDEKLADRLVALGVADETVRALSEQTRRLVEDANALEIRARELEGSLSTILGVEEGVLTNVADLISSYSDEIDQSLLGQVDRLDKRLNTLLNRSWHPVMNSRRLGQSIINTRDYPIHVAVTTGGPGSGENSNSCDLQILVDGNRVAYSRDNWRNTARLCFGFATVPPGSSYEVRSSAYPSNGGRVINWHELY